MLKGEPVLMNVVSKITAGVFAFFLHRYFTFRSTKESKKIQALKYFSVLAINIPCSSAVFTLGLFFFNHPAVVKLLADIVCVAITYWVSKIFVFNVGRNESFSVKKTRDSQK